MQDQIVVDDQQTQVLRDLQNLIPVYQSDSDVYGCVLSLERCVVL